MRRKPIANEPTVSSIVEMVVSHCPDFVSTSVNGMGNCSKHPIGWREWVLIDSLGLPPIKAKIDTGARTSALHAFKVRAFRRHGNRWVRFCVHPRQQDRTLAVTCEARVLDRRLVTDSGGHTSMRYVIRCPLHMQGHTWPVEFTLTNRDSMRFRVLVGRTALRGRFLVDPGRSFVLGGTKDGPPAELTSSESQNNENRHSLP